MDYLKKKKRKKKRIILSLKNSFVYEERIIRSKKPQYKKKKVQKVIPHSKCKNKLYHHFFKNNNHFPTMILHLSCRIKIRCFNIQQISSLNNFFSPPRYFRLRISPKRKCIYACMYTSKHICSCSSQNFTYTAQCFSDRRVTPFILDRHR